VLLANNDIDAKQTRVIKVLNGFIVAPRLVCFFFYSFNGFDHHLWGASARIEKR